MFPGDSSCTSNYDTKVCDTELDETIPNLCVLSMVKKQNPVQIWICTEKYELP